MTKKSRSIAFRLTFYVLTGVFIMFSILVGINYMISFKMYMRSAILTAEKIQENTFDRVETKVAKIEHVTEQLKSVLEVETSLTINDIVPLLKQFVNDYDRIAGSALVLDFEDENGEPFFLFLHYSGENDTVIFSHDRESIYKGIYKIPASLDTAFWSEPHYDPVNKTDKLVTYFTPLYKDDMFVGMLTADIRLQWLDDLLSSMKLYETGFAFLISREGILLTHPVDKGLIMKTTIEDIAKGAEMKMSQEEVNGILQDLEQRKGGMAEVTESYIFNGKAILIYRPMDVLNGTIIMLIPRDEALKGLYRLTFVLLSIAVISFLLLAVSIYFIIKRNLFPLKELTKTVKKVGEGDFNVEIPKPKKLDEVGNLSLAFKSMKDNLRKHIILLDESTSERNKIESEILVADKIQKNILAHSSPPDLIKTGMDIHGLLKPARLIGGDFYDFFMKDKHLLYFILGNVTGKGIPSSMFMGMTRAYFRSEGKYQVSSDALVNKINLNLVANNPEAIFVTLFCGIMDVHTGFIDYCNAGHTLPYLLKNDGVEVELTGQHGAPAGIVEGQVYKSDKLKLNKGETLILYTDGITESKNAEDEVYGKERLKESVKELSKYQFSASKICDFIVGKNIEFTGDVKQEDNRTVLCIKHD